MNFHNVRFPSSISLGASGGPERKTEIVTLSNGHEERNAVWQHSRRRFDAGIGVASLDDLSTVVAFYEARMGQLYAFRWKDWADFKSCAPSENYSASDQQIAVGDGTSSNFQLRKAYSSGGHTYWRPISKPVAGEVVFAIDGALLNEFEDYVLDTTTGEVSLNTPLMNGQTLTAGFEFDIPVRFDADKIETNVTSFAAGDIPNIPVIEVRL